MYDKSESRVGLFPSTSIPTLLTQDQLAFKAKHYTVWRTAIIVSVSLIVVVGLITTMICWLLKQKKVGNKYL